ncbi:MAG: FHA domain-containing protein [Planctomycetaceae bacterium]
MNVFLQLTSKSSGPKRVRLKSMTVIGRSKQCQLRISSTEVSREHCQIAVTYDGAYLVDLGSSNGTEVDGHVIKPGAPVKLASGMRLSIGPAHFIVQCEQDVETPAADSDPFQIEREKPLHDTALISPGSIPTRLDAKSAGDDDSKNRPRRHDAMTELSFATIDDDPHDDFSEWNMNVLDEGGNGASIHEPADGDSDIKPKKPFSLFSLLKRHPAPSEESKVNKFADDFPSDVAKTADAESAKDSSADQPTQGDGATPIAREESLDEDIGPSAIVPDDQPAANRVNDDLNDFLKKLS